MPTRSWGRKLLLALLMVVLFGIPVLQLMHIGLLKMTELPTFLLYLAAGFVLILLGSGLGVALGYAINRLLQWLFGLR